MLNERRRKVAVQVGGGRSLPDEREGHSLCDSPGARPALGGRRPIPRPKWDNVLGDDTDPTVRAGVLGPWEAVACTLQRPRGCRPGWPPCPRLPLGEKKTAGRGRLQPSGNLAHHGNRPVSALISTKVGTLLAIPPGILLAMIGEPPTADSLRMRIAALRAEARTDRGRLMGGPRWEARHLLFHQIAIKEATAQLLEAMLGEMGEGRL